jgi:hypothetical protein
LAITIATGSEDRAVAGIERLIKRTIEVKSIDVRRPSRGERPERPRERERDRERAREAPRERARAAPPRSAPADEFFDRPYEPSAEPAEAAKPEAEAAPAASDKKPAKVAALLGGGKR